MIRKRNEKREKSTLAIVLLVGCGELNCRMEVILEW